jgi:hypothetical protein
MVTIAKFLTRYIAPALKSVDFEKTGKTFRLSAANGDQVIVEAQPSEIAKVGIMAFYINVAVVPRTYHEVSRFVFEHDLGVVLPAQPTSASGLVVGRVKPSADVAYPSKFASVDDRWYFNDDASAKLCGARLVAKLLNEALPLLTPLLDRKELAKYLALPRDQRPYLALPSLRAVIALLVDLGPTAELQQAIDAVKETDDRYSGIWAEERLAELRSRKL